MKTKAPFLAVALSAVFAAAPAGAQTALESAYGRAAGLFLHLEPSGMASVIGTAVSEGPAAALAFERGYRGSHARLRQVWAHLADRAAAAGEFDGAAERAVEHYLRAGTLATRITAALPEDPVRADLERVYRELCDCLAEGRPFGARGGVA